MTWRAAPEGGYPGSRPSSRPLSSLIPRYAGLITSRMRTLRITVAYDGTDFSGWQAQPAQPTIQGTIEQALREIEGMPVKIEGSGRTDAGVHALGQVASFGLANPIPSENLRKALNRLVQPAIRVISVDEVSSDFHARHSAVAKTYEYRIQRAETCPPFEHRYTYWHPFALDEAAMTAAAPLFEGEHDFRSLASNDRAAQQAGAVRSTVRTIFSSRLNRDGDLLVYRVRGSGFLYHMVRNIVGTLLEVGRDNLSAAEIPAILDARDRAAAGPMVPASGLFLVDVEYES